MDLETIETNRDALIQKWFDTVFSGKINENILLLFDASHKTLREIKKLVESKNLRLKIHYDPLCGYVNPLLQNENIILNISKKDLDKEASLDYLEHIYRITANNKILFVHEESNFYKKSDLDFYTEIEENIPDVDTTEINEYFYYIGDSQPLNIIKKYNAQELKNLMKFQIDHGLSSLFRANKYLYLLEKTNIISTHDFDNIYNDLQILEKNKVLTSRLGVVIYRLFKDIKASTTTIGRYFHKEIGSKSKAFNKNNLNITMSKDLIKKGTFKAYDLTVDEKENLIRQEIAKKLISLKIKQLDAENIAKATELPLKEVKKLLNK